jgi:phosphohistidine phosphatase
MDLFLIRHADAIPLGEPGITVDAERPLSEKGVRQSERLAQFLNQGGFHFDRLLVSPLLRARQTAEVLLRALGNESLQIEECEDLVPDARSRKLAKFLRRSGAERIALVSHLPFIGEFAAWMIGSKKAQIDFAKGGMAQISTGPDVAKGTGILNWLVVPAMYP